MILCIKVLRTKTEELIDDIVIQILSEKIDLVEP